MKTQCFKIKRGTDYDKAVKRHFSLRPNWNNMYKRVSELLDENISKMGLTTETLWVDLKELKKEKNKKLFTKDGKLKGNNKKANEINKRYQEIIEEEGLSKYKDLGLINFTYGVMRFNGEELKSFVTSEDDIYYKADFDLAKRSEGLVEPITEIEYEEKYLEELKKKEK